MRGVLTVAIVCGCLWGSGFGQARTLKPEAGASQTQAQPDPEIVTTRKQVTVDGRVLKYTARAGYIPIRENETGEVHGQMFFMAYTLEPSGPGDLRRSNQGSGSRVTSGDGSGGAGSRDRGPGAAPRPLTFAWNGGPGSSSSLVHLLGFGPRRLEPDGKAVDNQGTWLGFTDLVFVDPIGTGYSRPTKAEYGPEFYQNRGDAESVAEFIRIYRNRFEAWDSPLFLAGESFGVTRASGVADVLQRRGLTVNGVVLIGLSLPLGQIAPELRTALMLPTYTAAAHANKKLPADLQADLQAALRQAETWAQSEYAPALAKRDALTDAERQAVLEKLSRFTGLAIPDLDPKTLGIGMAQFAQRLLRAEQKVVGHYDSRMTGPVDPAQTQYDPTKDPSLEDIIDDDGVVRYLRTELGFKSDLPYQGPFGGGYPPATSFRGDWMSVKWVRPGAGGSDAGGRGAGGSGTGGRGAGVPAGETAATPPGSTGVPAGGTAAPEQPLRRAMAANPSMKVLSACGYYDLVCAYAANAHVARTLDPAIRDNVTAKAYGGGHAIYTDRAAQLQMKADVGAFMQAASASPARKP